MSDLTKPDDRKLKTMDGNTAAAHVAYAFSEVSAIYPITPSSPMAENMDQWVSEGRKNIFGEPVKIVEMQSEGGASGAVHGSSMAGAYTTTFTASQGLLLMIPNMYKIAAEHQPAVFHIAARALASHALSIFGDQSDVMSCRQTGFAMLASNSVQQVMDLAAVAHLATIAGSLPMMHFFDGFRTSHEYQKIRVWDYDTLKDMVDMDAVKRYKARSLNPNHPHSMGSAEQPEAFFQHREAQNTVYNETPDLVAKYMDLVNEKIGTDYKPFNYYGAPDAEYVSVAMGSVCDAAEEVVDYLSAKGQKVGIIEVHLYRPFSVKYLLNVLPETVKKIAVLDRTKEPGAPGEPLYLDIVAALKDTKFEDTPIAHGRYGLGSKDVQPGDILAVYENLEKDDMKEEFTLSINDDVTHLSLTPSEYPDTAPEGTVACKFWGLGADGTVGANKNSVKIIGDHTDKYVQAYFQYDSKKSGGITISHLRFGDKPIRSTYYVKQANFVACHNESYLKKYDMVEDVKPGGYFLLNCTWTDDELEEHIPGKVKRYLAQNNIHFYTCDAVKFAKEIGLGARRTNTILQAAFFKIANIIPIDEAEGYMKDAIRHTYGRKGEKIVNMNIQAVEAGIQNVHEVEVPASWAEAEDDPAPAKLVGRDPWMTKYLNEVLVPMTTMNGDNIPVSTYLDSMDGSIPSGTAQYEKRGVSADVPHWISENCIQCNRCSMVCPHGVIRPFALSEEEAAKEEAGDTLKMVGKGTEGMKFTIGISALDCTGCGLCAEVCPAKEKALVMHQATDEEVQPAQKKFDYLFHDTTVKEVPFKVDSVKGSQFKQPLLEFSGACPGCGEAPYAKLITQLFGDRMYIANATGCTSIWGNSAPSTPYTVDKVTGKGPAWANSLFEDNAEFGFGMEVAVQSRRAEVADAVERLKDVIGEPAEKWLETKDDYEASLAPAKEVAEACEKLAAENADAEFVTVNKDMLTKPSTWIFGGDGWAYDIGYGGLDHVLASGENVNVMVFDTEVYSNTGGQSSKSTPLGAVAKFAAAGKSVKKKNLAQIAMAYGYVYVAQIAMGADYNQAIKAIKEAEAYNGPSLIIAYSPCINHGIKKGMNKIMIEMQEAVDCGYWNLMRFNPDLAKEGKNPLTIDSKAPTGNYQDFIMGEVRYNSLKLKFPERADHLFKEAEKDAADRYTRLVSEKESYDND
ncbi:MAG: pyruvate:ferredoxin (flavodoxin) oxidoreductase [Eubacteriales bacterium]|nr:pyruvate:ferredoxin (flavodoxin) oxidoreductase [Eubacteriales bacterium]